MSMNVPVMITDTVGFWDKEVFTDKNNIYFIKKNTLNLWVESIRSAISDKDELKKVSVNGNKAVKEIYNSENFYKSLKNIVLK